MPRPKGQPNYDPATDIWAALRDRGLITSHDASRYRTGRVTPSAGRVEAWRQLGYDLEGGVWPEMTG